MPLISQNISLLSGFLDHCLLVPSVVGSVFDSAFINFKF